MTAERHRQSKLTGTPLRRWLQRGHTSCGILLICLFLAGPVWAQAAFTPFDVEAAYLYNFGKFVRRPADAGPTSAPFTICILGNDPFGEKLSSLVVNETIQGHPIAIKHLATTAAADSCQIVFIGHTEEPRLAKDLAELAKRPVLTVSAIPDFLEHGGMIQFLQQNNKVRFAVNLEPAGQSGLTLSSDLLKVAVYVDGKPSAEVKP